MKEGKERGWLFFPSFPPNPRGGGGVAPRGGRNR
jgi:hypothetical protein